MKKKKKKPHLPALTPWEEEKALRIRDRYRYSLSAIGASMDYHVYDITERFLSFAKPGKERNYIVRCKRYFDSLGYNQRRCFLAEVLEKGRVYPFWFTSEFTDGEYLRLRKEVLCQATRIL